MTARGGSAAIVGTEAHKNLSFLNEVKNLVIARADYFQIISEAVTAM
jgi:hypothetical protein